METGLVKSVFKSGENMTSKEAFTKMWIELINKLERSKSVSFCVKTMTNRFSYGILYTKTACSVSKEMEN